MTSVEKIRVCFLDIDGVLNFAPWGEDLYYDKHADDEVALDAGCIEHLKSLVEKFPDLRIVWSTDWRMHDSDFWEKWKNPVKHLELTCSWLRERVIGITPKKLTSERWHEVKWWLDANASHNELAGYVILDDLEFPAKWFGIEKHVVQTDPCQGFTEDKLQEAINVLESYGGYDVAAAKRRW